MIVGVIQARMGSARLPGKILKKVNGAALLGYQVERVRKSRLLDKIIVATSVLVKDDVVEKFCKTNNIEYFRGSENDVLSRYYECAQKYNADIVVRLTADCPLSDPKIIDDTIKFYMDTKVDYAANTVPPETSKYPDGFDVEVFSMKALKKAYEKANDSHDREHVTFYFWKYNNDFKIAQLYNSKNCSKYRLTVDYPEDFEVVEFVIKELKKRNSFGHLNEIIEIIDANPDIKAKNSKYYSGIGWKN
ncbi:MAG: 3-deoxy-manno-octulosonate cytidylyltransferase [Candidatus Woesebacteria bacterium GW2011_GWA2_40_7]|uniref:3-deoxy-manno-octulosonate cytidylyltransferase n=1 Tax=Candidatus Woesebacteria bacterium GW2011_GWA2_40_7 TaxID=1618562 RepID=A0A0G0TEZ6_9BACT|nr:MAG: 3-deoxy-manno-octulosonate cytidylyltransferase [Candidatus Woesebacteria bacterium GW2011_GWA2_40_7]